MGLEQLGLGLGWGWCWGSGAGWETTLDCPWGLWEPIRTHGRTWPLGNTLHPAGSPSSWDLLETFWTWDLLEASSPLRILTQPPFNWHRPRGLSTICGRHHNPSPGTLEHESNSSRFRVLGAHHEFLLILKATPYTVIDHEARDTGLFCVGQGA